MSGRVRGFVLLVALPRSSERDAQRVVLAARRALADAGLLGANAELVPLADDTDAPTPLAGIRRAAARMLARMVPTIAEPDLTIDLRSRRLTHLAEQVKLTARSWDLLALMLTSPAEMFSVDEIAALWPTSPAPARSARVAVHRLRAELGDLENIVRTAPRGTTGWFLALPAGARVIPKEVAA